MYDKDAPHADKRVFDLGIPVLGICYGLQFMVYALGGKVAPAAKREYGHAKVEIQESDSQLFQRTAQSCSRSGCRMATRRKNCLRVSG